MVIGNVNVEYSVAKVRKNKLSICSVELQSSHFEDNARLSNCVTGLHNIKIESPNMFEIVKCMVNVFNNPKQLLRRGMFWHKAESILQA